MRRWAAAGTAVAIILAIGIFLAVSTTHNAAPARAQASVTSTTPTSSTSAPPVPPRQAASTTNGPGAAPPGAWALPPPKRYIGTAGVGFPHTPLGAIAMGYRSLSAQVTVDPDIAASVVRATYLSPRPDQIAESAQIVEQARTSYGLSPTGPTSTTIALSIEACRIESAGANRVVAGYEGTLVVEGPTIQGVTSNFSNAMTLVWTGSDWRIDPNFPDAQPLIAFPGDAQAAADGWHACSECKRMPAPGGCADPLNWAGCAVGGVTQSVTSSIFDQMASWWADAYRSMMSAFSAAFLHAGDISVTQFQGSRLWQLEVAVGATIAAGSMIWAGARAAWTRSGEALATAAVGLTKAVFGTAMVFTVVATLMGLADALTVAIMQASTGDTASFTAQLSHLSDLDALGDSTALVFLFALLGVIVTAVLWVEMLIRAAGIVIVTLSAPIGAGGLVNEHTAGWWKKTVTAELALIFIKPIVALVLALGFTIAHDSTGMQGVIVGFMILASSAVAWPMVARLFTFFEAQVAAGGVAAAVGFAGGMASRAGAGGRSSGSQPMWRSMEDASTRGSEGPSALGGSGGAATVGASRAAGAAGSVGLLAVAAQHVARHAMHAPGRMIAHAADMAGMAGSSPSSPGKPAPATKGPWAPTARAVSAAPQANRAHPASTPNAPRPD